MKAWLQYKHRLTDKEFEAVLVKEQKEQIRDGRPPTPLLCALWELKLRRDEDIKD